MSYKVVRLEMQIAELTDVVQQSIDDNERLQAENERLREDAERYRAVINERVEGIAICKEGAYGTPWVAIGPKEATSRIDAAMEVSNMD